MTGWVSNVCMAMNIGKRWDNKRVSAVSELR